MVICVTVLFVVLTAVPPLAIYFKDMYQLYQFYVEVYDYVYCGTEWLIMFEMVLVYVYIFRIATKNRRSRRDSFSFRNIRFTHYVPIFIVLTFVLFAVFPDQQYYYYLWIKKINFSQSNHKFYMILMWLFVRHHHLCMFNASCSKKLFSTPEEMTEIIESTVRL